jgi:putative inorganic carbon (HCO3(-)) transporter
VLAQERIVTIGLVLAAAAVAVLWPLSAYAVNPLALPVLLALALTAALIVRRPEYGLALAIALSPLINCVLPQQGNGNVTLPTKPFQLLVPALAGGVLVYSLLVRRTETPSGGHLRALSVAILLFTGSTILSSVQALEPSASLSKVVLTMTAAIVFFTVRQTCQTRGQILVVAGGAVLALLIASVQGIADHLLGVFSTQGFVSETEVVGRVQGSFGHPNLYGGFLAFLMPLAAAIAFSPHFAARLRWLALSAFVASVPALVFSYGRGAILGLLLGSIIWLALLRPRAAITITIIVAVAAIGLAPSALKSRFENNSSNDVALRSDIWESAIEIYSTSPVLGVGPHNFQTAYERLPSTTNTASQRRLLHDEQLLVPPHAQSIYFQALAEQGIVGLMTMLAVLIAGLVTAYRASRAWSAQTRPIAIGVGVGLLGVAIHGVLEIVLFSETIVPVFGLLAVVAILFDWDRAREPAGAAATLSPATL